MHLRSLTLKGFKSFPDRTRLDFSPGVSVIVGPNGSGKSNITDAVLWALGEQSPLAVRGQTMQDVIFAGGHGVASRSAAEVEVVLDNSDGAFDSEFSEISILRRLERSGEGEYRLNGARCRLVDVLEVLSDTGLGKEMHSVVSQGRVESIIHSKPRDRRLLIEEAAGLGKHRKRRRRAQLKLERTQDNLDRALDVERAARSRLRPLKRQAEAAELHERLERQSLEARLELARDAARGALAALSEAERVAAAAAGSRDEVERALAAVARRREAVEAAFAEQARGREALSAQAYAARSAADRIAVRLERAREIARSAAEGAARRRREVEALVAADGEPAEEGGAAQAREAAHLRRIEELERELAEVEAERAAGLEAELARLASERDEAAARRAEMEEVVAARRADLEAAERAAAEARNARRESERAVEAARRAAAEVGAELASVNHFLRSAGAGIAGARALAEDVRAEEGYELAVAAALGSLLRAGVVSDAAEGGRLLDSAGGQGGSALLPPPGGAAPPRAAAPPGAGAPPLLDRVAAAESVAAHVERLLADAWVVPSLDGVPADFAGIAVTLRGRVLFGATGELRQAPAGGDERVLEAQGRRERLVSASEEAAAAEHAARTRADEAAAAVARAAAARGAAPAARRGAQRELEEAQEAVGRAERAIVRRREEPVGGPAAVRHAELTAELRAERRLLEQARREQAERAARVARLRARIERDEELARAAERAEGALLVAAEAVGARRDELGRELEAGQAAGEATAAELRECAREEAELQERLRQASQAVTSAEVRAQQARDAATEAQAALERLAERLGLEPTPAEEPLTEERRAELEARVERLARRREQLGPVNPLAKQEYEEAVRRVEELEEQRRDLEAALAELDGLIKETDKRIRESFEETFEAAAKNFEEVVQHLFPGGRGRLRLVRPDGPRPVIGGEAPAGAAEADAGGRGSEAASATARAAAEADAADSAAAESDDPDGAPAVDEPGVEVEVTPAGKSMKRLSLLSGGEKSLVALAFLFAVFLARPCPFYILDEVEAALDDLNIDRFLQLIRRFSDRAQFIIVTHQKRTMDAADCLYGVSMGGDGVSKVVSRKLTAARAADERSGAPSRQAAERAEQAA
ncbi:MAG: AAA family ATPase [Thermoleophilaceae bacterium]|nr:AAA family ATPase [Thermoleophilaceae bacterium]